MDQREIDNLYVPFPRFDDWPSKDITDIKWDEFLQRQEELVATDLSKLNKALKLISRAAAIETGAIESLYEVDRGFTFTVAAETIAFESVLAAKGQNTKDLIESQIGAYEYILDFATHKQEIAEAWIRELHEQICKEQKEYLVQTATGPQKQELPLGEYKSMANHVIQKNDKIHAYCPVDMTAAEMSRLVQELRTDNFENAHPILQSAYVHYAFVCIHPFADGNGRVARALASVYTYRAARIPLLILAENRREYFKSLELADQGNPAEFINFVTERLKSAIDLVIETLEAADQPSISELLEELDLQYITEGGYSHQDIDNASYLLMQDLHKSANQLKNELQGQHISLKVTLGTGNVKPLLEGYRQSDTSKGSNLVSVAIAVDAPLGGSANINFLVQVPVNASKTDYVIVHDNRRDPFQAQMQDLIPQVTTSLALRLNIYVRKVISVSVEQLVKSAKKRMSRKPQP